MPPRFATTTNGRISMEIKPTDHGPVSEMVGRMLRALDGHKRFAFSLWQMPASARDVLDVDLSRDAAQFIQCAGAADRMTVEVSAIEDGRPRLYTIGRRLPAGAQPDEDYESVDWDNHQLLVHPNEIFNASEAEPLFVAYYETGVIPDAYLLRPVVL